jgi:hypothetical protein
MLLQLEQSGQQIFSVIRKYITNAFNYVFPWAARIVFAGIIPALLLRSPKTKPD